MRVQVVCTLPPDAKKGNPKAAHTTSPPSLSLQPPRVLSQRGAQHLRTKTTTGFYTHTSHKLRPRDFTGINVNEPDDAWGLSKHQNGREIPTPAVCDAEDMFSKVSVNTDTHVSKGRKRTYDVSGGPNIGIVSLQLSMSYAQEASTDVSYLWKHTLPQPANDSYYLYVPDGWDPNRTTTDSYINTPYEAYTHWSTDPFLDVRPLGICPGQ